MKKIRLTQGYEALIDDEDFQEISKYKWYWFKGYASRAGKRVYSAKGKFTRKRVLMHRQIVNAPDGKEVDHANRNGLDNRRTNLRICTHTDNMRNFPHRVGESGYRGVSWHKCSLRWMARIKIDKYHKYLGVFPSKEEAALAYDSAAREHHGEFAILNFDERELKELKK